MEDEGRRKGKVKGGRSRIKGGRKDAGHTGGKDSGRREVSRD